MFNFLYRTLAYSLLLALSINPATAAFDSASETKITAADGAADDWFGYSVAIDGTRMAVGVYKATIGSNSQQGAVYIYNFDGTLWTQSAKLSASDGAAQDLFGRSVSLVGNRLAVGATGADIGGNTNQGAVYIYDFNGSLWSQTTKLTTSDGDSYDNFGGVVSLDNNRVAVGAKYAQINGNSWQGAAYIFDLNSGTWDETTKLTASDGIADDRFGGSVSLDGNRIAVGAIGADFYPGSAYIFDLSAGSWNETTKLTASDGTNFDSFGTSISLYSDRVIVGADGADINGNNNQGAAYIFDLSNGSWSQTTKLTAANGTTNDYFGRSVSLNMNRLAVGANRADVIGKNDQGTAYVFNLSGGTWSQTISLTASDGVADDYFGYPVSLDGKHLLVGATGSNIGSKNNQGAVYIYTDDVIFKNGFESD